ncbi:Na+/H+ antiporter NhaC family protein [Pleionea litopenaei]|uniref:Na+/H+ antiporter NhaC family protein n=1 Tax=Pleionea litopenaei TaxID=3070815 RepID=A0AA51RRB9_9GAMM|nr:Na+/H+ antiporter NhaC family protein [Pleionea sp. HL-JVS1]WMS86120.1 Na+/H+ antiporter NhaC family protein [Pleionea sp. HL-JVS1]
MSWWTLLPPVLAIALAIWKREVILALLVAIFSAEWLLADFNIALGLLNTTERIVAVFQSAGNTRILLFSLLIGALLMLIQRSGGVSAFVQWVAHKGLANTPRKVGMLPAIMGILIFIETNLSVLTSGILARNLFDKFNMSRERLAFIIDSTCAPVSVLIVLNAWGAYILGLLSDYPISTNQVLLSSIPLNFYAVTTLGLVFYTVLTNRVHGPMKRIEHHRREVPLEQLEPATHKRYMLLPLGTMIGSIIGFMWYTGAAAINSASPWQVSLSEGILNGSGSKAVLWGTVLGLLCAYLLLKFQGKQRHKTLINWSFEGMGRLLGLVTTVLLALALGSSMKALGTGAFVAQMIGEHLPIWTVTPMIFIAAGVISFTTGTSWGTFGILIPIGIPVAQSMGIPAELILAAILGGGVFGDHCSPISDTTIVSSLAAGCDHLDHVKTQLPYALTAGAVTLAGYTLASLFF